MKSSKIGRSILFLTAALSLMPTPSWLSAAAASDLVNDRNAIAQIDTYNNNNFYTPDYMMSTAAQRALEIRLESMRRNKGKGSNNSSMTRSQSNTNSKKQVITAKQYRYVVKRMQQKMPGRDAEVKQMLDRMVEVRN
jgi:hypothetical protein